jgi:signal transduction histidine kinase/CheY-like chemotaxis protein
MTGKILVAEDDPEARELLILLLGRGGYDLLEAGDGVEALDILRTEQPDLLITDIVMPRMDGYELVRRLRQDARVAKTPVIICSASYHEREVQAMAETMGVLSLSKPYDVSAVESVVATALHSGTPAPNARRASTLVDDGREALQSTQARLNSLVTFSRRLFSQIDAGHILESACHAARDILLAQCAELVIRDAQEGEQRCRASGLSDEETDALWSARMDTELVRVLASGGSALFPMSPAESAESMLQRRGAFASMLGVPIASGTKTYGHLSVINRIGLTGFTEQDLAVAKAIAAQVAVAYENAHRQRALETEVASRSAAEEEVRRLNAGLEQRVIERTAELEVLNRELEAFTYSVAHDLRAPLRLIDAHCGMLREACAVQPPGSSLTNHVAQIHRGTGQMSALIDGLLALSRVSHMDMRQECVALDELVTASIERLEADTRARTIRWKIDPLPHVVCDPELMLQVFTNLLSNAVKYTRPRREATIELGVGVEGGEAHVFVRDNGVGFDMRYAGKLFGVFQRLHRQDQFEGTGIGLATVSRIIERHGGRIWAESAVERGATFRFTLNGLEVVG